MKLSFLARLHIVHKNRVHETEEEGVEPPSPLLVNLFSRQTQSATLPLFQWKEKAECQISKERSSLFRCCGPGVCPLSSFIEVQAGRKQRNHCDHHDDDGIDSTVIETAGNGYDNRCQEEAHTRQ